MNVSFDAEMSHVKVMEIFITVEYDMLGNATWIFEARVLRLSDGIKEAKSAYTSISYCFCD